MRLLLDTHIFIWWNGNVDLLSQSARTLCEDEENTLVLSLTSIWKMQIKLQLGKLTFNQPLAEIICSQQDTNGIELMPTTTERIYALQDLPPKHRDPFDRLLIAQAKIEQMPLLTADPIFRQYEVNLL